MLCAWLFAGVLGALLSAAGFVAALAWLARGGPSHRRWLRGRGVPGLRARVDRDGHQLRHDPAVRPAAVSGRRGRRRGARGADGGDPRRCHVRRLHLAGVRHHHRLERHPARGYRRHGAQSTARTRCRPAWWRWWRPPCSAAVPSDGDRRDHGPDRCQAVRVSALAMLLSPALVIGMLLARRHLIESLLFGIAAAAVLGLLLGLITPYDLLHIAPDTFGATGVIVDGMSARRRRVRVHAAARGAGGYAAGHRRTRAAGALRPRGGPRRRARPSRGSWASYPAPCCSPPTVSWPFWPWASSRARPANASAFRATVARTCWT